MFAAMTFAEATKHSTEELKTIYADREAANIANWVIEHITETKKTDRIIHKEKKLSGEQLTQLNNYLQRLMHHEPVQYVLNEAWFYGLKYYVDKNVLIPRPETEELIEWVISDCKFPIEVLYILDIGTGSGCIPISLKRKLRRAQIWSCDISEAALQVAKKNATTIGADVNFLHLDFLDRAQRNQLPSFNIIISNPPYIPEKDKEEMQRNVVKYEPATALFVPDNDPLIFYKAIADFGKEKLIPGGMIYLEIHEDLGEAVCKLFQTAGYYTEIKKDMQGKERMVKAVLSLESGVVSREL